MGRTDVAALQNCLRLYRARGTRAASEVTELEARQLFLLVKRCRPKRSA